MDKVQLNSLFRIHLERTPAITERQKQISQLTQLLAEESVQNIQGSDFALFAIDCTAHPRIYAKKVSDRLCTGQKINSYRTTL